VGVVVEVAHDGGLVEDAIRKPVDLRPAAARHDLATLLARPLDELAHLLELSLGRDRADLGLGLHRVPDPDRARPRRHPLHELVVERLVHERPRAGHAGLSCGGEDAGEQPGLGGVHVGVLEDDVGRLAAELERHLGEALRGGDADRATGLDPAGERDLRHVRVADERLAGRSEPGDDVEHARREAHLGGEPGHLEHRGRGHLGGLDDDRIARRERRRDRHHRQEHGRVPGHDHADDAERLAHRVVDDALPVERDRRALDLVRLTGEVAQPPGYEPRLHNHLAQELAVLARLERADALGVLVDRVGEPEQEQAALARGHVPPGTGERRACAAHAVVDVLGARGRDARPGFTGGGIDAVEALAAAGRPRLAIHVEVEFLERLDVRDAHYASVKIKVLDIYAPSLKASRGECQRKPWAPTGPPARGTPDARP
jgi:hypothetical protein